MFAYRLLIILLSPLILAHLLYKSLRLGDARFLLQRLGLAIDHIPRGCLWFHCASVGEVNTVLPLLRAYHERRPQQQVLVTTNTVTGAKIVNDQHEDWLYHAYLPMDWRSTLRRFIVITQPLGLFIMETELWPNLVSLMHARGTPARIINGRLSRKTTGAHDWIRAVYRQMLGAVAGIYVRSERDRALYLELGADADRVSVVGNLKFTPPPADRVTAQTRTTRDYVVVASSHDNEERAIAEGWQRLQRDELLVIAPRHPERGAQVLKQLATLYNEDDIAVRSRDDAIDEHTRIYLLDTVGELASWFPRARLVIMAGSFIHRGGHNILEPAHLGKAVICGPHMESFRDECEVLLAANALLQVESFAALETALAKLLDDDDAIAQLEANTRDAVAPFADIIDRYLAVLLNEQAD